MRKAGIIVRRDEDGLMPAQREYIEKFIETGSETEARRALNLRQHRINRWFREDAAFRSIWEQHFQAVSESVQLRLKTVEEELPDSIRRLLQAQKPFKVTCPCGCKETFTVAVDSLGIQAKMVELMMKAAGHLKDVRRLEGEVSVTHLTAGQRMALSLHSRGKQISEQSRRELIQMGFIDDNIIDAEVKPL